MKGVIWNSDGFEDTMNYFTVHEAVREQTLDYKLAGPARQRIGCPSQRHTSTDMFNFLFRLPYNPHPTPFP